MIEKYKTCLNIRSKITKKSGNKPWRIRAWCAECEEELSDFESFNYYECYEHVKQRCKEMCNCPRCGVKLILEETHTTVA